MPGGEYSIEIDPRTVDAGRLAALHGLGFNRLSFGVQDFDPEVQAAVHRVQPAAQVFDLVAAARAIGFESLNVDLIYGLPRQTERSFARTLEQVAALRPDRIALYGYAHLPERFKPQRRILSADLPDGGRQAGHADAGAARASRRPATPTSAWTISRCRPTRSPWRSGRGGCTAISRATAPSPIAT